VPRKKLADKIVEAIELASKLNKITRTLSPELRSFVLSHAVGKARKMGRRRRKRALTRKVKSVKPVQQ